MENRDEKFIKIGIEQYMGITKAGLLQILYNFTEDYPNDMELGAAIRKYFYELNNKQHESIEAGKSK